MSLDELYHDLILDHCKLPRGKGVVLNPTARIELFNPLCGDKVALAVKVRDGRIEQAGFDGSGCSISQATASMMVEVIVGKTVVEALALAKMFRDMMRGDITGSQLEPLGDAQALEGVRRYSARIKCALLAWDCIEKALAQEVVATTSK